MYFLLGISLTLAFLLIVNMAAAIGSSVVWRVLKEQIERLCPQTRAHIIFGLRVLPVAAAVVFVAGFVVPAYLLHEPESSGETVSGKLAILAVLSFAGVIIASARVLETWWVTRRLVRNWLADAEQVWLSANEKPLYKIEHPFPVIAVIGIFRPRVFVAESVFQSLSESEFRAALAHEYGHVAAQDNLKRTIMRICKDLVIFPVGGALDKAWSQTAEVVADQHAAGTGRTTGLDLAAALIKIARIAPANSRPAMPSGAFLIDNEIDVTARVTNLLSNPAGEPARGKALFSAYSPAALLWSLSVGLLLLLPVVDQRFLATTHDAIERLVHVLR